VSADMHLPPAQHDPADHAAPFHHGMAL
jgi:hypothetical protein